MPPKQKKVKEEKQTNQKKEKKIQKPDEEDEEDEDYEDVKKEDAPNSSVVVQEKNENQQRPDIFVPDGPQMKGKEKLISLPPVSSLPDKYKTEKLQSNGVSPAEYLEDALLVVLPDEIFFNNATKRDLISDIAVIYDDERGKFCARKNPTDKVLSFGIIFLYLFKESDQRNVLIFSKSP